MPEFLSEIWLRDLDRSVQGVDGVSAPTPIVIEQVVHDVPGRGEVRYQFRVDAVGARVIAGEPEPRADVRLTTDYATAVAIARGEENAQIALAHGRLRLGGNIDTLVRSASALGALDDAAARLRGETTYPSP